MFRTDVPVITVLPNLSRNAWLARFEGDRTAQEFFGTDTLPTAFTLV